MGPLYLHMRTHLRTLHMHGKRRVVRERIDVQVIEYAEVSLLTVLFFLRYILGARSKLMQWVAASYVHVLEMHFKTLYALQQWSC